MLRHHRQRRLRYRQHKANAKHCGIQWFFTYVRWCLIWAKSGHWHERGNKGGRYVMARYGDVGPYSICNVRICTFEENRREATLRSHNPMYGKTHSAEARAKISRNHANVSKKNNPMWGKKRNVSTETRQKLSLSSIGNKYALGYRHTKEAKAKIATTSKKMWERRKEEMKS